MALQFRWLVIFAVCCVFKDHSFISAGETQLLGPYPIEFAVSETKLVKEIPKKDRDFAYLIPGHHKTYKYWDEHKYYYDYSRSYYAITCRKAGSDCLRHWEILTAGCIPYFTDLDLVHQKCMPFFPRELIKEAMHLKGVNGKDMTIDHSCFDEKRYYEILHELMEYTKNYLTAEKIAEYILKTLNYSGHGKVLFISGSTSPDYLRCCTLIGLKEFLQDKCVDYPKIPHIYKTFPVANARGQYGRGFSYTRIVEDIPIDRSNIEQRIANREFELIIYGSVHRGRNFLELVKKYYPIEKIAYLCGEDGHSCEYSYWPNLFIREYQCLDKRLR